MMTAFRYYELKRNPGLIPLLTSEERKEYESQVLHEQRSNSARRAVKTKRAKYKTWPTRRRDHLDKESQSSKHCDAGYMNDTRFGEGSDY